MVEKPEQRLKRFAAAIPSEEEMRKIIQDLEKENSALADYAIALICQTFVERALEVAISAQLNPLDEQANQRLFDYSANGPISDFAAKIKLGYSMGIFGQLTKNDLNRIREIRNAFAHSLQSTSFATPEIAEICEMFQVPELVRIRIAGFPPTARKKYITQTTMIAGRLKVGLNRHELVEVIRAWQKIQRVLP